MTQYSQLSYEDALKLYNDLAKSKGLCEKKKGDIIYLSELMELMYGYLNMSYHEAPNDKNCGWVYLQ